MKLLAKRKLKQASENYVLAYKNIENNDDFNLAHIKYEIAIVKSIMGKRKEALAEFLYLMDCKAHPFLLKFGKRC